MASGTVKWWDRRKGYGFIVGESGQDVFVHYTTIQGEGYKSLAPGEPVRYELIPTPKGFKAEKVERVDGAVPPGPGTPPRRARPDRPRRRQPAARKLTPPPDGR